MQLEVPETYEVVAMESDIVSIIIDIIAKIWWRGHGKE